MGFVQCLCSTVMNVISRMNVTFTFEDNSAGAYLNDGQNGNGTGALCHNPYDRFCTAITQRNNVNGQKKTIEGSRAGACLIDL